MEYPIILFDGVCNLCNSSVQFIIRRDRKKQFRFASLQGRTAQQLLAMSGLDAEGQDTIVLVEDGKIYTRSTAVLRILRRLGGFWRLAYAYIIVPRFIRDGIYKFIARNRYRWFGRREECMVPEPGVRERFLD